MNYFITAILLLSTAMTFATELRSPKLRKMVCDKIFYQTYFTDKGKCLAGSLEIAAVKNLESNNEKHAYEMAIVASFEESIFKLNLTRTISVGPRGVEIGAWFASAITDREIGPGHTLASAKIDSDLATIIENQAERANLPSQTLAWRPQTDAPIQAEDIDYYTVKLNGKVLGHIAYVWYESLEFDIKGYEYANFNLRGEKVGGSGESWNYYE